MRKIFLFLLLLAGWALIFSPWTTKSSSFSSVFFAPAHPSEAALPQPWQNAERVQLARAQADIPVQAPAGETYTIRPGDTLGQLAKNRGLALSALLEANPHIGNASLIYPGQRITFPAAVRAQGSPVTGAVVFAPGATVQVSAAGFPPGSTVRVGFGRSISGYKVLGKYRTDAEGGFLQVLQIPADTRPGESVFFMVTSDGSPTIQRISETFLVGQ
jgi:LysM repeat protein